MKIKFQARLFGLFLAVALTICSPADLVASMQTIEARDTSKSTAVNIPKAEQSVTQHKFTVGGVSIPYTATAGTLIVRNEKDLPYASMGFTAYTRNDMADPGRRPITFAYNGGPGSCSMWLHMGALGPRRIVTTDTSFTPPAPYKIVDNEYSILDQTDLVMIDPVSTGFSHAVGEANDKDFWGVDADIESIARFIRQYITENGRWNSPKYILGESYGTLRSAGVVDYLQCKEHMFFNGVILVSMATDLEPIYDDTPGNQQGFSLHIPTYTAVAWYHKVLPDPPADIQLLLDEVRTFALREYSYALAQGDNLPDSERTAVIRKLCQYTGLSADYIDKANLRITIAQFANELLRNHRETVGILDGRILGANFDPLGKNAEYDPFYPAVAPAFKAAFLDYLQKDLKFGQGKTYISDADLWAVWDYRHKINGTGFPQPMVNTGVDLAHAMGYNPNLRVLVLQGMYDMITPFLATEYMVSHLSLPKDLRSHIQIQYYDTGHMMYIHEPSLKKFKSDIASFMGQTNR